ncbi:Sortase family protein [Amycolatopsis tolypomycina]|uniref:Sortase family protein n=1 Tax=Amycolatopsis tolypomycina TaxID=208445 RepID=A0A1H5C1V9_9PSEU|nr:class F sortase [Amycolatopsis tolypomycina]SED60605.1 Sortase family protein [Amycolatopsis tolypomycina]
MARHDGDWRGEDWFVDEWHRGTGWAAVDDEPGDRPDPFARKPGRGRLLAGFALGAATVLAVQYGPAVLTAAPVAVVTGTALPAAQTPSSPSSPAPQQQRPGTVRLPGGGTATLVRADLGPDGELPVPTDLGQATWWGASLDAASGASVFAGHVNWRGATGPFAELWHARIGAEVTIVDSAGKTWRYRIAQLVTVHKSDLPARADYLFGPSGPHRVVLVTCGGRWVGGSDGYEENRVVVADPA